MPSSLAASPTIVASPTDHPVIADPPANPLAAYFDGHREGRGIWKWQHYFDIYHRHFSRFIGREAHIVEIGIYSGGSLDMWRHYFGTNCRIFGVDIQPACKTYEDQRTRVFIGDQADRGFWKSFRDEVPVVDILIDDGGHEPHQQIITLEEMLPHIQPGGIYLCEDIHGLGNEFAVRAHALADQLNSFQRIRESDDSRRLLAATNDLQRLIHSVHFYPFVCVIEKHAASVTQLEAPKRGTQWQPFL